MPTIKNPGPRSIEGPITYADVLAHVPTDAEGQLQPDSTNAGAIRAALGRGSNGTVQKHLDAIRAELTAAAAPQEASAIPAPPGEAVAAMWAAAWSAAQRDVLGRLDRVTAERDQARSRIDVLTADRDAAIAEADEQRDQAAIAGQASNQAQAELQAREASAKAELEAERQARTTIEVELQRVRTDAAHAAALAAREHEIERQALQSQIDKLQERVAELRALEIWAASQAKPATQKEE